MATFSLKQLLGSVALIALGMSAGMHFMEPPVRPAEVVLWFIAAGLYFAAWYNLLSRPLYGMKLGMLVALVALILTLDAWLMIRKL